MSHFFSHSLYKPCYRHSEFTNNSFQRSLYCTASSRGCSDDGEQSALHQQLGSSRSGRFSSSSDSQAVSSQTTCPSRANMQDGSEELQRLQQTCPSAPSTSRGTGLYTGQLSMPSHSSRGHTALSGSPSSLLYKTPRGTAAAADNHIATAGHVSSREAVGAAAAGSTPVPAGGCRSNGRRSSSGGRGHNPSPRSSKPSGYTAALLKRKAAAALQAAPSGASKQQVLLQQQKQQEAGDLGALAAQLLCSRAGNKSLNHTSTPECSSVAVAAAQLAAGTTCLLPSAGRLNHKQHHHQQQQQHHHHPQQQPLPALQVCSAQRRSSGGGGTSSGGSYAAQASSRAVQLSARGACSSKEATTAAAQAAAAAGHSGMMVPTPAGAACPSQQLSSALSALEAVTAANTAAAAMLRAVASEAARSGHTAGATLQQRVAFVPDKAAAGQAPVDSVMYENQGEQQVPLLHLGQLPLQQQQVQLQQVFEGLQLCHSAADAGHSQPAPRGAAAAGEVLLSFRQAAADTALADRSAGVHRQAGGAPEAAVSLGSMAAGVELLPAGGIGYSKLRRLHASSSGAVAAAAAAASPRLQQLLTHARCLGQAATAAAGQHQLMQELGAAHINSSCTAPVHHQQKQDHQQEQEQQRQQEQGQDGAWASVDVVTSWYHAADDDDDDDDDVRQGFNPPQAASHAAAAVLQPPPPPAAVQQSRPSPRLWLQQPAGGGHTAASLLTAPASPSHWSTGGGIEYAKLLRGQAAPPDHLAAARGHHQHQQQQQQVLGVGDVQLGPAINPAEEQHSGTQLSAGLITGWYGGGLQSNGSEHGSSGSRSPEAVYSHIQQQLPDANLPVACGDAHGLLEGPGMLASRQRFTSSSSSSYSGWSEADVVLPSCHGWDSSSTCVFAADAPGPRGVQGSGRLSTGQVSAEVVPVGSFDLQPCLPVPLLSARDASVTQLLEASQHQINCMESTLASMLLVAKRWTDGGAEEAGDSLRGRFKP